MKKITLSLVSVMALSGWAFAGGDIAPVEPVAETPVIVADEGAFYVGIGYGYFNQSVDNIVHTPSVPDLEFEADTILLQAGYQYNAYVAFEGRYWVNVGDITQSGGNIPGDYSGDVDSWGLYVKPMYPVADNFDIYALLGYADTSMEYDIGDKWDTDGFSWGVGAQYEVMDNVLIFADYVSLSSEDSVTWDGSDIEADIDLYTLNIGISYQF